MATTARIPNPVSGSIDGGRAALPPTRKMLAGRYAMVAWLPGYVLATLPFGLVPPYWLVLVALTTMVVISRLTSGSWWRGTAPGAWWAAHFALGAVVLVGWVAGIVLDAPLLAVLPAAIALGAVAGAAAMHVWLARRGARR